jgi:hypothetical protein
MATETNVAQRAAERKTQLIRGELDMSTLRTAISAIGIAIAGPAAASAWR